MIPTTGAMRLRTVASNDPTKEPRGPRERMAPTSSPTSCPTEAKTGLREAGLVAIESTKPRAPKTVYEKSWFSSTFNPHSIRNTYVKEGADELSETTNVEQSEDGGQRRSGQCIDLFDGDAEDGLEFVGHLNDNVVSDSLLGQFI